MASINDEIAEAEREVIGDRCLLCRYLSGQADRDEWNARLIEEQPSNQIFQRVFVKRGLKISEGAVRNHRQHLRLARAG